MKKLCLSLLLAACAANVWAWQSTIHTVAGAGGGATGASVAPGVVTGIVADASGNLYISFSSANVVMRLDPTGALTPFAGNGTAGYSGDTGAAASAELNAPLGIALDSSGNLYIADSLNNRVRKVSNGVISTVAGDGATGYGGDGGLATSALVGNPLSVALDAANNLYILQADLTGSFLSNPIEYGPYLRKVSNGMISTIACDYCSSSTLYVWGYQIAADASGNIWFVDQHSNDVIWEISNGAEERVAGTRTGYSGDNGPATSAQLNLPDGVFVDSSGNLYIADTLNNRIRKVDTKGIITTFAGNGTPGFSGDGSAATAAELASPTGVTVDNGGNLYIIDSGNQRIRKVSNGVISTVLGAGAAGSSGDGEFSNKYGIIPFSPQSLWMPLATYTSLSLAANGFCKVSNGIISTVAGNGTQGYSGDNGPAINAELNGPLGLTLDTAGNPL